MFVKSRVLYVIETQRGNANQIYKDLDSANLLFSLFNLDNNNEKKKKILLFLENLPTGTVFSKSVLIKKDETSKYFLSLPFFSSHVKVPVKPGEIVWIFNDLPSSVETGNSFSINSYWMSRVHGLRISEDVNYTHNDRDVLQDVERITNSKKIILENFGAKKKSEVVDNMSLMSTSIIKPIVDFGKASFELDSDEIELINKQKNSYPKNCMPVISSNSDDLVLQGSNNTLIKMTTTDYSNEKYSKNNSNKGEIILSSGIGSFANNTFTKERGSCFSGEGLTSSSNRYEAYIPSHPSKPIKIITTDGEENFKNISLLSLRHENKFINSLDEGAFNSLEDASRIVISESSNNCNLFLKNYSNSLNLDVLDDKTTIKKINSSYLKDENKKFETFFYKKSKKNITSKELPSIDIVSSNITMFSREKSNGIKLIKEYYNDNFKQNLNSLIRINEKGDIFLDANRIFIGNGDYFNLKKAFIEQNNTDENFKEYNGALVILGESKNSQQLVLGNQLKEFLLEKLDVNRSHMNSSKILFNKTHKTINDDNNALITELRLTLQNKIIDITSSSAINVAKISALPPPVSAAAPVIKAIYDDIFNILLDLNLSINAFESKIIESNKSLVDEINRHKIKRDEEESLRLEKIEKSIDKILSKISKTS